MIARRFSEDYTNDSEILEIIELHDEPYKVHRPPKKGACFQILRDLCL